MFGVGFLHAIDWPAQHPKMLVILIVEPYKRRSLPSISLINPNVCLIHSFSLCDDDTFSPIRINVTLKGRSGGLRN